MTRINGTYLERLMFKIFPYVFFAAAFIDLISDKKLNLEIQTIISIVLISLALWIIDSIFYLFKKTVTLKVDNESLYFNKVQVNPSKIYSVSCITDNRAKWNFTVIQFNYYVDDKLESKIIMAKSQFIISYLANKTNPSIKLLLEKLPILKNKCVDLD
jgi:hypothetical protein